MTDIPERATKRKVACHPRNGAELTIGIADFRELDVGAGDTVKVLTYSDRIEIVPEADDDA